MNRGATTDGLTPAAAADRSSLERDRLERVAVGGRLCGRVVEAVLPGRRAVLCRDLVGGRQVVLKPLPKGCLRMPPAGDPPLVQLHPHVRERLLRIRELADPRVGGLCSVEEDELCGPMAVWSFVPGKDLSALTSAELPGGGVLRIAWDVVDAVDGLHLLGLVHGRLHLRNVVVMTEVLPSSAGGVVLTHPTPLFVDDPALDAAAIHRLLGELNARHRPWDAVSQRQHALLARALASSDPPTSVGRLRERLLELEASQAASAPTCLLTRSGSPDGMLQAELDAWAKDRRRSLRRAMLCLVLGMVIAAWLGGLFGPVSRLARRLADVTGPMPGPALLESGADRDRQTDSRDGRATPRSGSERP